MDANAILKAGRAGLWIAAESALYREIEKDGSGHAYAKLAQLYRQMGRLQDAAQAYGRVWELTRDDKALWCSRLFSGNVEEMPSSDGTQVIPFKIFDDFLSDSELKAVWEEVERLAPRVEPMPVYWDDQSGRKGAELILEDRDQHGLREPDQIREIIEPRIWEAIDSLSGELTLVPEMIAEMRFSLVFSKDGQFSNVHRDDGGAGGGGAITFVFYLSKSPHRFSGGELLLFDTDKANRSWSGTTFSTIVPMCNRLVAFPSFGYHQVTKVTLDSVDPLDARIAVPIHVKVRSSP